MRVEYRDRFSELEPLLSHVEKPSRYIDHEWGALSSPDAQHRVCLIYPDVYEVGLPNQGIAILYNVLNQQEGESCERSYVPWIDMADAMRAAGVPLLSLEGRPLSPRSTSSGFTCLMRWPPPIISRRSILPAYLFLQPSAAKMTPS